MVCAKPRGLQQASISKGIQASKFLWSKKTLKTLGIIGSVVWLSAQYLDQTVSFLVFWFTSKKIRAKYDQQGQGEASFAPISFEVGLFRATALAHKVVSFLLPVSLRVSDSLKFKRI